ncbi:MAG TPA: DNA recombination protein RmuC [Gammaproteobacteria bacterium]|nr:DNA recombination protein RmuC [Gammaproteobacteria bacterium]
METSSLTILLLTALLAFGLGATLASLLGHRRQSRLREENVRLQADLDAEKRAAEEKAASYQEAREKLSESFSQLASEALRHNSGEFLKLAQENLKQFQVQAQGDLAQREKAVENLVKPIREALEKTESQVQRLEAQRQEAHGALTRHLESLQSETRNLTRALRRPEVRGQWGEMTLKRLAELAGMVEHCDFFEQESVESEGGRQRPDMVVRLPDKRAIVVDAKAALDAYLDASEAEDETVRDQHLTRHARNVRSRVKELADKAYWNQFAEAPDFVVLFIPGEQFLSAALEVDRELLEFAMERKVILATPTSLIALLRAVAFGWRQEALAENAERIRQAGKELYDRLTTFSDHLGKVGRNLDTAVDNYNKAVGSFDSRVLPGARRFAEMGIQGKKELEEHPAVEKKARSAPEE